MGFGFIKNGLAAMLLNGFWADEKRRQAAHRGEGEGHRFWCGAAVVRSSDTGARHRRSGAGAQCRRSNAVGGRRGRHEPDKRWSVRCVGVEQAAASVRRYWLVGEQRDQTVAQATAMGESCAMGTNRRRAGGAYGATTGG
ncbi:hypothetical protein U1Q18_008580 [Sarracenia purpurea var. burkii]